MPIKNYLRSLLNRAPNEETDAIIGAIEESLGEAGTNIQSLKTQFNIQTAEGEWLDEWGSWFLPRKTGESDRQYSERILDEVTKARVTIGSIRTQAMEVFGEDIAIDILEPYTLLFVLSESELSGAHKMADGKYYRTGTVVLSVSASLPERLLEKFTPVKAGGVIIYITHEPILVEENGGVLTLYVEDDIKGFGVNRTVQMSVKDTGGLQLSGNFEGEVMGGRQVMFNSIERALELLIEQIANTPHVLNRSLYPTVTNQELWEDLFTSVSYERRLEAISEEGGLLGSRNIGVSKSVNLSVVQSPDFYTGSLGSVEYWEAEGDRPTLKKSIEKSINRHMPFSHIITSGSVSTISDYANYTIGDLNTGVSFDDYNKFSSNGDIVTTTSPI